MTAHRSTGGSGAVLLALLAPLSMFAVDPGGWYPFGPVKWLVVALAGFGGAGLVMAAYPVRVPRLLGWALVALVGWLALAAAVGLDPVYAWTGTPERHFGVLTWVLCSMLLVAGTSLPRSGRRGLGWGLGIAGLGVGAVATLEALGWEPAVLDVASRLTGTFGSAAYLGDATALLLPVAVGLWSDHGLPRRLRQVGGAALPLLVVAAIGSGARAAWFGLAVASLTLLWVRRSWLRAHPRQAAATAAVGVVVLAAIIALTPAGARLASLTDPDAAGGRGRVDEWRVASRVLLDHPLTGVGPEGYRIAFHEGVDARYERAHGRDEQPDRAHSAPLDVALAGGLPALVAWLAVVLLVGRAAVAVLPRGRSWEVGIAAGLVAHQAGQVLLFPVAELEPLAWLLAGLVVAPIRSEDPATTSTARVGGRVGPLATAGAVLAVALAGLGAVAGAADVVADRRAQQAVAAIQRGDHRGAADAVSSAVRWRPDVVRLRVLAARVLVADDQGTLAGIRQLDAALDVSPGDPIVLRERLRLLVERAAATGVPAHLDAARQELDRLLAGDPSNASYWEIAEQLADLEGRPQAAAHAHGRWMDLTPAAQRRQ